MSSLKTLEFKTIKVINLKKNVIPYQSFICNDKTFLIIL